MQLLSESKISELLLLPISTNQARTCSIKNNQLLTSYKCDVTSSNHDPDMSDIAMKFYLALWPDYINIII